jgi:hypothetical protein
MTCSDGEDYEEKGGILTKGAQRISLLLTSAFARKTTRLLPTELRKALAGVFLTAAQVLSA